MKKFEIQLVKFGSGASSDDVGFAYLDAYSTDNRNAAIRSQDGWLYLKSIQDKEVRSGLLALLKDRYEKRLSIDDIVVILTTVNTTSIIIDTYYQLSEMATSIRTKVKVDPIEYESIESFGMF